MTVHGLTAWLGAIALGAYMLTGIVVIAQRRSGHSPPVRCGALRSYPPGMHLGLPLGLRSGRPSGDRPRGP